MPIAPEYLHLVRPDLAPFDAYLYGRNSVGKRARSVTDQLAEGRDLCDTNGWPVADVFKDPGVSASRHARKRRRDFEAMLEGIAARGCRIVVAFEASRYYRDLEIYVRLRKACHEAGVLLCYNGTVYDLSKREDRKATAMDAVSAEDEAEGIRDRNLRTTRRVLAEGKPHGPAALGFKRVYDPDTGDLTEQVTDPDWSPVVSDIFTWAEAGKSYDHIRQKLREAGRSTRYGNDFGDSTLRTILRNRAYIGRRMHYGDDAGDGTWSGFIPEERFNNVQDILDERASDGTHDTAVKYVYSGIGWCGEHLDVDPLLRRTTNRTGRGIYRCELKHIAVDESKFEAYCDESILKWLSSRQAAEAFRAGDSSSSATARKARTLLKGYQRQLKEARAKARMFRADGTPMLSIDSLADLESELLPRIARAEQDARVLSIPPVVRDLVGNPEADAVWDALDIGEKRLVVRRVVNIRLFKARAPGVKSIEPGRVQLTFYGEPGFQRKPREAGRNVTSGSAEPPVR
ncbi:recombinase family protein [Streptomyces sp. NPDC048278]|uniref:recombinase family protein n=1 Tax=Streptomyces sp. NPDC048278 TaxID=3155809 RepID=UPI0034494D4D